MSWVIARTAAKRPTLMHLMDSHRSGFTRCGVDVTPWSRAYFEVPIPQVTCIRCALLGEVK